jgi:hypothetical protein
MDAGELEAAKAAFLARGGQVTTVPADVAYGIDPEADKAKRRAARQAAEYERIEHDAENRFQRGIEERGYYRS